ncbi:hypothetical protein M9458_054415 [Cirrhinus mrigala]|uniref:AIG1-type G domain-containing protein n=1 Tax=Cirrhinus mrigala TaxID=683832 RepID=A0ABD0MMJ8_CIRMR
MYVKAQENRARYETEDKYEEKVKRMEYEIDGLKQKLQSEGSIKTTRKLNLVLCGRDALLKISISRLIKENTNMKCYPHLINLVELPALFNTGFSEEQVMHHTFWSVSLCDPGVHVFLFIIPDAPLTDKDKAEMEEIQRIFSSRINKHIMMLIIQEKNMMSHINAVPSSATEIQMFEGRRFVLQNSSQVPDLLQDVENMIQKNRKSFYSTFMCFQAQIELEKNKHKAEIEELKRSVMKTAGVTHLNDDNGDDGVRIVLLGKTGVGKSATGNTILRRDAFTSTTAAGSVTRECKKEIPEVNRRQITVIDTPGLFDTEVENDEIRKEIVKCVSMAAPGPHVFLLVIQVGRFTKEEKDAVKMIQETFGDKSRMYTMVLFTRGDELKRTRVEDYIKGNRSLQNLIHQCGNRCHVFNNEIKDQTQVSELLDKTDCMVKVNGGSFYTNEMFQQVENNIKAEQERIMKEKEEEFKRKEQQLRAKYKAEREQLKRENERQRQEMQNKLKKSEEEFKKKEDDIKKETDENLRKELQRKLEEQQKEFEEENKKKRTTTELKIPGRKT